MCSENKINNAATDLKVSFPKELFGLKKMKFVPEGFLAKKGDSILLKAFYIDENPITYFDFELYVKNGGTPNAYWNYDSYHQDYQPVTGINWYHVVDYCNWRSKVEGLDTTYVFTNTLDTWGYPKWELDSTANGYRLPTSVEFQYAAHGGKNTLYPWGNEFDDNLANYDNERGLWKDKWWRLASMKELKPNDYGLYNMSGNIWHFCNDNRDSNTKVLKGGSWGSIAPKYLECSSQSHTAPSNYNYDIGFRCVRNAVSEIDSTAKLNFNITHKFYKYTTSHYEKPPVTNFYDTVFQKRLGKFIADYYPNCLYFQEAIDQQPIITPEEMAMTLIRACEKYKVNPLFLVGIMASESGFASCSFPRWYNNPMAYHWQNRLMSKGLPKYDADVHENRKYKNLQIAFEHFCRGIRHPRYIQASKKDLDTFHLIYVGYRADEWMYTLSRIYKDVAGIRIEPKYPTAGVGKYIYTNWQ